MPDVTITVRKDGPYRVEGEVNLVDHEGKPIPVPGPKFSLCRCGGSTRKPFCDGTHSKIGFKGAEQAQREFDQQQAAAGQKADG
jgi:CDGSH-type Zn-finger protein